MKRFLSIVLAISLFSSVFADRMNYLYVNGDGIINKDLKSNGCIMINDVQTFTDEDATPDVSGYTNWNTNTTTATITDFDGDDIEEGQILVVNSKGAITFDVTSSGIVGGSTDIVTAAGDVTMFYYDGTDWYVIARMDLSDNLN